MPLLKLKAKMKSRMQQFNIWTGTRSQHQLPPDLCSTHSPKTSMLATENWLPLVSAASVLGTTKKLYHQCMAWRQGKSEDVCALQHTSSDVSFTHRENGTAYGNPYLMDQNYFGAGTYRSYSSMYSCTSNISICWVLTWPK